MTRVLAVRSVFPPHRHPQAEITEALARFLPPGSDTALLRRVHASVRVEGRHLALPLDRYGPSNDFGTTNALFVETALELGPRVLELALADAGLTASAVDLVMSTTVTGLATPSLEARLATRAGLRPDVRRLPLFGLGCAAGAAGVGHLHDLLAGRPGDAAVLLSTELCSLTLQSTDSSMANLVAGALFGDGAAALVAVGRDHPLHATGTGPEVVATRSRLYPGTEHLLGWDIGHWGMRMVLGRELPDLARLHVAEEVESFLAAHDLKPADVDAWICHPGGPKILDALSDALALPESAFAASRRSLAAVGNLSSASVLHILEGVRSAGPPPGSIGLMLGFGPGFASELVLLRW
ncbi:stilbene synthase [Streptomyces sp. WM6373]|uniref:type III polyketide synthase n=1 Tax=Streptomyces TaxID=1883 RepID=UPI0004C5E901|nr:MULTISPECIES: 3-oxoacyl-[acyl-carrier-protein] synthase III C-terminal domain-containing protein [unclassified Streptomyces]KJY19355.1 stilbene synthase [Streptomyces sp. NRRL S-104]KOU33500.1 stilbene synthase [Streptomyces sp. WM6373]KOU74105.1 stilbene synthase [Streptomyces sp. IGB124]KOU76900.1 stilbene synthase [Streptomyces sp. XY66]KOU86452.1 stilbene synthase [Streptomyces sp. XY58]